MVLVQERENVSLHNSSLTRSWIPQRCKYDARAHVSDYSPASIPGKPMNESSVDVLIPVFNGGNFLKQSIESIQGQNVAQLRIIIVDDGSTDATPELLSKIAQHDRRIEVLTKRNSGIVDALNEGLACCRAAFIARHDADDVAYPDRLAEQIAYLQAHSDCVAVSGAARHIDEHGRPTGVIARMQQPDAADPTSVPSREPYLIHPFLMMRRSAIEAIGGYRYVYHAEDTDLYWRLQEIGRLHNMKNVLGDYRMHAPSVSSRSVLNGRIGALCSQLAAISAIRRRSGRSDLVFPREALQRYHEAGSLRAIFEAGSRGLDAHETDQLEISLAAKMLDLTSYRPYELDADDCRFIREAIARHARRLRAKNRAFLWRQISGTAARLAHNGMFAAAAALLPASAYPAAAARLSYRLCVPTQVRRYYVLRRNRPYAQKC
jgi:glycosyltransferase involved in cell wall biosynthesis